jgi:hypothetical protein
MIVSANGSDFKPIPEGTYVAVCIRVVDLGTQVTTYKGADKTQRKVLVVWEVPEVRVERDGEGEMPALIMQRYTASLHEKAVLRKNLEAWRGRRFTDDELKGFDLKNIVGQPCQIQILHSEANGNVYANIAAIMAAPKGMPKPVPEHPLINFSLDPGEFSEGIFGMLSDKLRATIEQSPEYKALKGGEPVRERESFAHADMDDEIPF